MSAIGSQGQSHLFKDILTGLVNLGYDEQEALVVLKDVLTAEPDLDVPGALRASLKALARQKMG
jgi:Holliday junction DNA helicase subunit RuvA